MPNILLDTGVVVGLLNRKEKSHAECVNFFKNYKGRILSTESVLTESLYLLGPRFDYQKKCLLFFIKAVQIIPLNAESLLRCMELIEKYVDIPMDFADATLVSLAEDLACGDILTLDHRGFKSYRWLRRYSFKIYP